MSKQWRNWARTESSRPVLDLAPRSVAQAVRTIERARETGHTVKPIGASHSFTAIGATDGIRLSMERLRGLVDVDLERGQVTLWAGTHLWELPAILNPLGLALENMGDIDRQTISGATSTGTHGTGLQFGGLATRIVGATLLTGTGDVLTVNAHENADLLPAVQLGLGALGVLLTVTVQCVPRFVLRAVEAPAQLDEVLRTYAERNEQADHFEFYWFPHTASTRTKTNTRLPIGEDKQPLSALSRVLDEELMNNVMLGAVVGFEGLVPSTTPAINRAIASVSSRRTYSDESHRVFVTNRRVRFREMEYALPFETIPEVMRELQHLIERKRFRVSFPVEVRAARADELWLSTASGRQSGYIAVHRYWRDRDHEYFREVEALFRAHDGRPHWGKMHTMRADDLRTTYAKFDDFVSLRDRLDPDRIFANDYLRRVLGD
ncbi:MAG: FAD-binding protein [Microbacteriaceae bacterium]|nr:FAD-binding protein [Microbacteriaceae bacterium]